MVTRIAQAVEARRGYMILQTRDSYSLLVVEVAHQHQDPPWEHIMEETLNPRHIHKVQLAERLASELRPL
jgi:hypothetical protein